jgi:hypothetical protein
MRKIMFFMLVFCSVVLMSSEPVFYGNYTPVFMVRSELEKAVRLEEPRSIKNPGKVYIKDQFIFINEKYRGYHVIDNTDPANPVNKGFVHIDGCLDMAIRENIMYADNSIDLVAITLNSSISAVSVSGRIKNAFPEPSSPEGFWYTRAFESMRPDGGVIVRWEPNN